MTDLIENARADIALRKAVDGQSRDDVLAAYADVFGTASGQVVLRDILDAFHDRENSALEEQMSTVDHPYRVYLIEGQRMAALLIRDTIATALAQHTTGDDDDA